MSPIPSDLLLAEELAFLLRDPDGLYRLIPRIKSIVAAQAAEDTARPCLTISNEEYRHFGPNYRMGNLILELKSRTGDQTSESEHRSTFGALFSAIFGGLGGSYDTASAARAAAKSQLCTALLARGRVQLDDYGEPPQSVEEDFDHEDLRSVLRIGVIWKIL